MHWFKNWDQKGGENNKEERVDQRRLAIVVYRVGSVKDTRPS